MLCHDVVFFVPLPQKLFWQPVLLLDHCARTGSITGDAVLAVTVPFWSRTMITEGSYFFPTFTASRKNSVFSENDVVPVNLPTRWASINHAAKRVVNQQAHGGLTSECHSDSSFAERSYQFCKQFIRVSYQTIKAPPSPSWNAMATKADYIFPISPRS
jgi:hypothetical protein